MSPFYDESFFILAIFVVVLHKKTGKAYSVNVYDLPSLTPVVLSDKTGVSFAQEDFDRPMFVLAYGLAGWMKNGVPATRKGRYFGFELETDSTK